MQKKSTVLFLLSFLLIGCTKKEMKETYKDVLNKPLTAK